jgi:hypothetical protein
MSVKVNNQGSGIPPGPRPDASVTGGSTPVQVVERPGVGGLDAAGRSGMPDPRAAQLLGAQSGAAVPPPRGGDASLGQEARDQAAGQGVAVRVAPLVPSTIDGGPRGFYTGWESPKTAGATKSGGSLFASGQRKAGLLNYGPGAYGAGPTIAEYDKAVARAGARTGAQGDWGEFEANAEVRALAVRGRIHGIAAWNDGLEVGIGAQGRLELVGASANVGYGVDAFSIGGEKVRFQANGSADAFVGAQGDASASITLNKEPSIRVGAGGFAGASASIAGQATLGGVGVKGGAQAWAGVGAKANLEVGFKDGKFVLGGEIGAALGVGFGAKFGIAVDFKPLINTVKGVGNAVAEGAKTVAGAVANVATKVGEGLASAGKAVGNFFKKW